jgi:two-component system NtrC family sensor kinase
MRVKPFINILLFLCSSFIAGAQDTTILLSWDKTKLDYIPLGNMDGWIFRQGHDVAWAKNDIDITVWKKIKPSELSEKLTDKNGKLEGWLRIKIKLDTAFQGKSAGLYMSAWAASEVYVDGNLLHTYGNTGANGMPFKEYNPTYKVPVTLNIQTGGEHIIAVHIVDFRSPYPRFHLKSRDWLPLFISITSPEFNNRSLSSRLRDRSFRTLWLSVNVILCLLFWLLAFQNRDEKNLIFIALTTTVVTLSVYCDQYIITPGISYNTYGFLYLAWSILVSASLILCLLLMLRLFKRSIGTAFKIILWVIFLCGIAQVFFNTNIILISKIALTILVLSYNIVKSWNTLKGAQWAVLAGMLLAICFGLSLSITASLMPGSNTTILLLYTGLMLSFPLSLLVYVAMRFKEIIREVRRHAKQVVQLSEEKKEQALNQQKVLQAEVDRQTAELRNTLENLKSTQSQLIQSEKMASLGELTAGIAHEIQNPLNFVNNFSEVNKELIDEMEQEMDKGKLTDAKGIAKNIRENEEKINQHGKRADAIVKGMLQHSRTSSGQKEPTDINALADEYLRLAYHGLRAKEKSFNAKIETYFDNSIGKINIIPQDIGRVLVNLINNAFYAVNEKMKSGVENYEPAVTVSTKKLNDKIEIRVKDNGAGIPQKVLDKVFQPFFTTKPTGQGTGLGLSLSYDIVKAHGGEIKVETKEGEGSEFKIELMSTKA